MSLISRTLITAVPLVVLAASNANAQLIPEPWVSVGARNNSVTYSVGAKFIGFGAELGTGPKGATGVDVLKFVNFPFVSPYVGVGVYSGDKTVAYSGGVQVGASSNFFLGVGYNSVRGVNGQIGVKF